MSQYLKFSHKKKYCGIKDIRVLFYSSIFQMIIVFPFIVLKYFSFCCHFSHSVLCCNRLVYSCFILFVKSDSNFNQNSSCELFILFHFCLVSVFGYSFFSFLFLVFICSVSLVILSLCYSVSFIIFSLYILSFLLLCLFYYSVFLILSFLLFCLYVILSLSFLSFFFCLYVILSILCYSVSFHVFVALPLPYFPLHFGSIFTLSLVYFFDIFA